jgi:hypothetical protein
VRLYRRLRFRTDDGLLFWWLQGLKYGQVGTTLTPLYSMHIGTLQRVRQRADGGFDVTSLEINFFTAPEGGPRLKEWRNPYTGETLPVRYNPLGPSTVSYGPDNSRKLPGEIGGARAESSESHTPALVVGDDVFVREETHARVFTPGRSFPFEVNDISVYHGSARNLADPKTTIGDATVFFAEVTGWQKWMNMGDRPGNLTSRTAGRKVRTWTEMPEAWRAMLAEASPDVAADPVAALDRPAARFDR